MMKEFYTIQEFSNISGVETSTLRHWDDIGLFSPVKRNPENNYRYYSLAQITALNFVTVLSDLGIPLKTIAALKKDRGPEELLALLDKQERKMDMEVRKLRLQYSIIHARRELVNYGIKVDDATISVLHRENKEIILWPRNEYNEGETFVVPLAAHVHQAAESHINLSFPVGGYWDDMESFLSKPTQPDHFFSIDPVGTHIRKAGDYLVGFARGEYGYMGDLPERMDAYAHENALTLAGPVYVMYLHDEICSMDPSEYLAQSCVAAVRPRRRARHYD